MQVVINIDDEQYNDIIEHYDTFPTEWKKWGLQAIKNGTPLPKGHGKLIDVDNIKVIELEDSLYIIRHVKGDDVDVYIDVPTVVEADVVEE